MNQTENNKKCCPSQLRYDIVSKDWVVIATGRNKRPDAFKRERQKSTIEPKDCIFCNLEQQAKPVLLMVNGSAAEGSTVPPDWTLAVIPNKYPAFCPVAKKICRISEGPLYHSMDAAGFCEIVITRDHEKHLALLGREQVKEVIEAYRLRYLALKNEKFVNYISIFHNHGTEAGASQPHPHSQIITSPLVDVDLRNALENSKKYYKKNGKCLYCEMIAWEQESAKRVVYENDSFLAVCPFAAKSAFEVIITPKKHSPNFEAISAPEKELLAQALSVVLKKIFGGLADPPYNFYIHIAPSDKKNYDFYHWHLTILPKMQIAAGFEMGARMEISTIAPEMSAEYLREQQTNE